MRKVRYHLIRIGIIVAMMSITYASAASLNMTADSLAAGASTIVPCDPDGVTVSYALSGDDVTTMTVQDIAAACSGGKLSVALANSAAASIGNGGPLTVSGTAHTLTLSPQPVSFNVQAVHVVIVGP